MIRRLIILLLIVGCAHKPPSTQFSVGMHRTEFLNHNAQFVINIDVAEEMYVMKCKGFGFDFLEEYYFVFRDDTLFNVYHGLNFLWDKHINYDKYATPPK